VVVTQPEGNQVLVVGMSGIDGGTLSGFRTTYTAGPDLWPNFVPWSTHGGSGGQNSRLDLGAARLERDRRAHRQAEIARWQSELSAAMSNAEWDRATTLVGQLMRADPTNREYRALGKSVWFRSNLLGIISGVVAGLIFIGWSVWVIIRMVSFNRLRSMAESAFNRGDYDAARTHYAKLVLRAGRNPKVPIAYARVLIAQHDYSHESLPIYAKAHALAPGDQEILHAYARALLLEPQTTAEAGRVYEQAMPSFPEPHLLEYGLGRVALAGGQYEEAGKRLRAALRGGVTTPALYRALCETYIKTRNFTAKALPVFEQQFPTRMEDREFLEAYLMACIDGKRTDPQVETLCQSILDLNPAFVPAYLHLSTILLQKNQVGQAIEEVKSALKIAPDDASAISMLALCYLTQSRKDEEALHAYRRALRNQPEDKELLRMLAAIFFERGNFDKEAVEIYHRSVEVNPTDVTTLRALAQTAQLTNNGDLAIRSIEALASMGQSNAKLTAQLADAYVRKGVVDPKAERVLREALRQEPNNAEYLGALARVLTAQDRTDSDCIPVYESHLRNFKDDLATGRQLAKAYIKADRYENALATTQRFLQLAPHDDELQRLNALASLYDNKIDEAVAEYQRILQRNAADPEALVNLALAYGQKLRVDDEAASLYERALALQPANERLHLARARVMVSRNDLVAGVESYKAAIKARQGSEPAVIAHLTALLNEFPEVLRVRWFFVELLVSNGNLRDAIEQLEFINSNHPGQTNNILRALETILAKDANNLAALLMRGQLLLAGNQIDDAVRMLEKAYQLRPSDAAIIEKLTEAYNALLARKENAEIRFRLGKLFYAQQEFDKAIGCFQKTTQDYRWEAESTKMLGKCFTSKGMLDLALQEFKKLVVDAETKELLYDLAQRYEAKRDLVGAKTVYRQLFAADINYKDVQTRFEMLSGSTSDPMAFEKTSIVQQMSEEAARRYELLDELGRGAMGIVYRARDKELEEVVALKILPDNMSNNPEAVRRFKIEARNARKLSHPHIVRIHDIGEEMGRKYISMEYVDGSDLKRKMKAAPNFRLPIPEVIKYAIQTADALAYAHRVGVVHRDIKPANIMLTSTEDVKVTDFGIAKLMDGAGEGTMIGAVIGTPLYMSPEQVQGIPVDNRADIYAYGVMLYELLNGRPPFTEGDLAYQHIHKEPPVIEGIPSPLWEVVAKCLQKKKEDRWETAELIVEALKGLQKSGAV
jgi:tetratricopeptide (TPR) repeat protein